MFPNSQVHETLLCQFRIARGIRDPGDPFPFSRQVAVISKRDDNGSLVDIPALPVGWVLIQFERLHGNPTLWRSY